MKLLSIAVPCYNSEASMKRCIDSLLTGGEDVEILIVDDGSTKDNTAELADEYEAEFPTIVKVIHKENGGHGSAVNIGIANASGLFFKVVDSDDWVQEAAYQKVLETLRDFVGGDRVLDLLITNFVYEKEGEKRKKIVHFHQTLPQNQLFGWEECGHFQLGHYLLMQSVIFRTRLLKESGLKLPDYTIYDDNVYVYEPLPSVKNMFYLDVNFYRYYISPEEQAAVEAAMINRIDQQLRINRHLIDYLAEHRTSVSRNKRLYQYMRSYLESITMVSSILLLRAGTPEHLEKKKELWQYLKEKDGKLYLWMRNSVWGNVIHLPGKLGREISGESYKTARKIFKLH